MSVVRSPGVVGEQVERSLALDDRKIEEVPTIEKSAPKVDAITTRSKSRGGALLKTPMGPATRQGKPRKKPEKISEETDDNPLMEERVLFPSPSPIKRRLARSRESSVLRERESDTTSDDRETLRPASDSVCRELRRRWGKEANKTQSPAWDYKDLIELDSSQESTGDCNVRRKCGKEDRMSRARGRGSETERKRLSGERASRERRTAQKGIADNRMCRSASFRSRIRARNERDRGKRCTSNELETDSESEREFKYRNRSRKSSVSRERKCNSCERGKRISVLRYGERSDSGGRGERSLTHTPRRPADRRSHNRYKDERDRIPL